MPFGTHRGERVKRKLSYKHHYQFHSDRPRKVLEATKYLAMYAWSVVSKWALNLEVQENWLDDTTANEVFGNQSNENWKEFLINSNLSTGNAKIHLSDPLPEIGFSEATKRHDHHTKQLLVTDCNENDDIDGWSLMII